ncbi:Uncharacterised protein [Mycobacteroides abscessus subsp. abscessus]|nr:Uncharacterised protein [Mycobacteroides abscessus subsp. abscessus]
MSCEGVTSSADDLTTADYKVIVRALRYLAANDFNRLSGGIGADPEDVARNDRHRAAVTALAGKINRLYLAGEDSAS